MPSTGPSAPSGQAYGGSAIDAAWLGELLGSARPARQEPVEFIRDTEPRVLVRGLPDPGHMPDAVSTALDGLARACRDAYGMGVEVTAEGDLDEVREALELIRRRLDL
jgi:hypothetical protein